jgi:hypothetical protein
MQALLPLITYWHGNRCVQGYIAVSIIVVILFDAPAKNARVHAKNPSKFMLSSVPFIFSRNSKVVSKIDMLRKAQ